MPIGTHIAEYKMLSIDSEGEPTIDPIEPSTDRYAVLPSGLDESVGDNRDGYPTIAEYVALEAADGYCVNFIGEGLIISYNVADMNGE